MQPFNVWTKGLTLYVVYLTHIGDDLNANQNFSIMLSLLATNKVKWWMYQFFGSMNQKSLWMNHWTASFLLNQKVLFTNFYFCLSTHTATAQIQNLTKMFVDQTSEWVLNKLLKIKTHNITWKLKIWEIKCLQKIETFTVFYTFLK